MSAYKPAPAAGRSSHRAGIPLPFVRLPWAASATADVRSARSITRSEKLCTSAITPPRFNSQEFTFPQVETSKRPCLRRESAGIGGTWSSRRGRVQLACDRVEQHSGVLRLTRPRDKCLAGTFQRTLAKELGQRVCGVLLPLAGEKNERVRTLTRPAQQAEKAPNDGRKLLAVVRWPLSKRSRLLTQGPLARALGEAPAVKSTARG